MYEAFQPQKHLKYSPLFDLNVFLDINFKPHWEGSELI